MGMVHSEIGRKNSCLTGQGATISVRTGTCPKNSFFKRHQCASRKNSGIPHVLPENILEHSGTFWNILEHRSGFPWSGPQIQELRSTVLLTLHLAPPLMMRRATCMSMSPNRALP
mmetsp:Transcript_23405/g.39481  ORF Transcript_23405/g.39481 Transcript_23405/m.39481 type:complete len:115 (+) Transcript_23405:4623-4967(+)